MTSPLEHPVRRRIVTLLRDRELSAGEISTALRRPRPGISHHLALLNEAGIVTRRLSGAYRYYRLDLERALGAWDVYLLAPLPRSHDRAA
jgi:DNA-binding transcriptional ArsR family regulator